MAYTKKSERVDRQEYLSRLDSLSIMELRTLNRCYLHPEDKRVCGKCRIIYDGIRKNFHIKKYCNDLICWDHHCKICKSISNKERRLKYREDYTVFIPKVVVAYKARAKELKLDFDLDADYLVKLFRDQKEQCFYTKENISFLNVIAERNRPHNFTPSLDRLDGTLGYTKGNVVWCAYYINRMKNDCSYTDFIRICKTICQNHIAE